VGTASTVIVETTRNAAVKSDFDGKLNPKMSAGKHSPVGFATCLPQNRLQVPDCRQPRWLFPCIPEYTVAQLWYRARSQNWVPPNCSNARREKTAGAPRPCRSLV
jgi:hypothetical protein